MGSCSRRSMNRSEFRSPSFFAWPPPATPTASFQRRHITMQPAFTVRLRPPRANWTPHKARHHWGPPTVGTLYQVLNATAEAMNEIMGVGAAEAGVVIISRGEWLCWGGGCSPNPHKDSRFRSSLFYPTAHGFRGAQPDRTPPPCPSKSPLH